MNSRVGAEMDATFVDFQRKNPEIIHPLSVMGKD